MTRLALFIFAWASACPALADCSLSLAELLDRYVVARGGYEQIDRQRALRLISINHEGKWNPVFDYRIMKPGYMWIAAIYDDGEIIDEGFDGKQGWEKWGSKKAEYVTGDAEKGVNQGSLSPVHLYGLHQMEDLGAAVKLKDCAYLDGREFYVVNVISSFGTDIDYFVDTNDFLLRRSRTFRPLHPTQDPNPILIEERWSDFRSVDGVIHPFKVILWDTKNELRLNWLEVLRIERLDSAKTSDFAKPD